VVASRTDWPSSRRDEQSVDNSSQQTFQDASEWSNMDAIERRQTSRVVAACEEVAVIHDKGRELPARLVDISQTGALISLFGPLAEEHLSDSFELSIQDHQSTLQVKARIVRRSPQYIAVQFTDQRADVQERLGEKVLHLTISQVRAGTIDPPV
jgi:hypothetical protein